MGTNPLATIQVTHTNTNFPEVTNDRPSSETALSTTPASGLTASSTLVDLEQVIERGLQTFIKVGHALAEIREYRLYHQLGYQTFQEYCAQRWGWTRQSAYYYISASAVAENVKSILHSGVPSYSQAIQLAALSPEQQREVAAGVDFSATTVLELKERIREVQKKAVAQPEEPACEEPEQWQTMREIIQCAVQVMEVVDLVPCATTPDLPAKTRIDGPVIGLSVPWSGRVYLNPPHDGSISIWVEKLCTERFEGNLTEAIAVLPAHVEADWFRLLRECAVCFIEDRFDTGNPQKPIPFPTAVVYVGDNVTRFHEVFRGLGDIWVRWKKPTHEHNRGAQ